MCTKTSISTQGIQERKDKTLKYEDNCQKAIHNKQSAWMKPPTVDPFPEFLLLSY
jgi:hypothetical protein